MDTKELLFTLTGQAGVSGNEAPVLKCANDILSEYGYKNITDHDNTLIAVISEPKEGHPNILLDAHLDEIGLIVTGIDPEGFLRVAGCGGVDQKLLYAQELIIHGAQDLYGVVCSMPPHLMTSENRAKVPNMDEIIIDAGLDGEQAKKLIPLGSRISFKANPTQLLNQRVSCKSLDDRAGMAAIILCTQMLKSIDYNCGLTVMFTSQEETSGRGAKTGAYNYDFTQSIAVDVSFAQTDDSPKHKCGKMGKGPMIGISPTLSNEISDKLVATAEKNEIPHQMEIMGGLTSTNADYITLIKSGIPTGLVSIPLRYMHTPVETVSISDVENTAKLLMQYIVEAGGINVQ